MKRVLAFVLVAAAGLAGGCVRVKPYQREQLTLRAMQPGGERAEDRFRSHWQTAREGSEGGFGAAGGGCGCN